MDDIRTGIGKLVKGGHDHLVEGCLVGNTPFRFFTVRHFLLHEDKLDFFGAKFVIVDSDLICDLVRD